MVKILAAVRIQLDVRLQRGQILGQIYKEGKSSLIAASETIDTARQIKTRRSAWLAVMDDLAEWAWATQRQPIYNYECSQSIIMRVSCDQTTWSHRKLMRLEREECGAMGKLRAEISSNNAKRWFNC